MIETVRRISHIYRRSYNENNKKKERTKEKYAIKHIR